MFEAEPASRGWKQVNHDGQDVPYMAATYTGIVSRVLMCVNQPAWRDYIKHKITKALEAGADGLFFDNLFSKCFCPSAARRSPQYAEQLFGRRGTTCRRRRGRPRPQGHSTRTGVEVVADSERHRAKPAPL